MRFLEKLKKKHYILCGLAILLTGMIVYLFYPFYLSVEQKLNMQNDTARIDIYNYGSKKNAIKILSDTKHSEPSWCKKDNGNCTVITENISRKWIKYNIKFKAIGDGNIQINLRGPDKRNSQNKKYVVLVDYRNFTLNNKKIFRETKMVWHDRPYRHSFKVKNGDIITLNIKARRHFPDFNAIDKLMLLSILILAFLLSYKLVQYMAKFKIIENNSRIDIVFVIVFALLLFVPMGHISDAQKSIQENRMLAKYPVFFANNGINSKFGTQFESWFNDRFYGRDKTIQMHTRIEYQFNNIYKNQKAIFFKKSGWMAARTFIPNIPSNKEINNAIRNIKKFNDFCLKNNMKLYVLIVPHKEMVYSELWYTYGYDNKKAQDFQNYIKKIKNSPLKEKIVYPYEDLVSGKEKDYVFFKQAHHWTDYGAFLGYEKLANIILKDFPEFNKVSLSDFNISQSILIRDDWGRNYNRGHTTRMLNLANRPDKEILNTEYSYYDLKKSSDISEKRGRYIKDFDNKNIDNEYRVFMTGNSQNEDLLQFMAASVKKVKYLRLNREQVSKNEEFKFMKHYKKQLLDFKPDMVVLTVSSNVVSRLTDFFKD